ncbi:hypothetical protein [Streptomyces sp. NPDC006784]|uniref:hypothetical protein n=1 Tax=Streptomyces sp. NPDC006784 TaxID=3364764 RepID=UPI0036B268DC
MTHEETVELRGGPMDGHHMPVSGWTAEMRATGVAHMCDHGTWGPGGRAWYSPPEGDPMAPVWNWDGDSA